MKFKKYWKIILPLVLILALVSVYAVKSTIRLPEDETSNSVAVLSEGNLEEEESETEEEAAKETEEERESKEENSEEKDPSNKEETAKDSSEAIKEYSKKSSDKSTSNVESSEETKKAITVSASEEPAKKSQSQEAVKANDNKSYCPVTIDCYTILNNMGNLKSGKESCLGDNGLIYSGSIEITEGESVKTLIFDISKKYNIKVSARGDYITGINNLFEKDCGKLSGWMYSVNGVYPNKSVEQYKLKKGDVVKFRYTCDCGKDLR